MATPRLITPYTYPVEYTPKHINRTGLPPKYLPHRITPAVDDYFSQLRMLKRRMNQREAQLQANNNYNIRDWISQEESRGIDLSEWLVKQGYNRRLYRTRRQRKQRKRTRRV